MLDLEAYSDRYFKARFLNRFNIHKNFQGKRVEKNNI